MILETDFETDDGVVRLVDCMPIGSKEVGVVRLVEGRRGRVAMRMRFVPRFDYGRLIPATAPVEQGLFAFVGPDALCLRAPVDMPYEAGAATATFEIAAGERVPFQLAWYASHLPCPQPLDASAIVAQTEAWWQDWSGRCRYDGARRDEVQRSLLTLKAMTYSPTGAIVAALTTSLPEEIGGSRNWDYRYCWLRDGAFSLGPLIHTGYLEEAVAWRDWLLRAIAGDPAQVQLMYGIGGEHRLPELELPWLAGYEASTPVRIGNAAAEQFQLDIFGEVFAVLYDARQAGLTRDDPSQSPGIDLAAVVEIVERRWREPDEGIWEIRGQRQHFTYSKVAAWTAMDRAIRLAEATGLDVPLERWRGVRDEIHAEVCARGFDAQRNTFVQYYGGHGPGREPAVDADQRLPAGRRPARAGHDRGHPARDQRWPLRLALCHRGRCRRAGRPRRRVPDLLVLAGQRAGDGRARRAGRAAPRSVAGAAQRCRAVERGVRPRRQAPAGQLPAGVFAHRAVARDLFDRLSQGGVVNAAPSSFSDDMESA